MTLEELDSTLAEHGVTYEAWSAVKTGLINPILSIVYEADVATDVAIDIERKICDLANQRIAEVLGDVL